jgi:hypothetical protein
MTARKSRWMGAALTLGVMVWMFPALANAEFAGTLVECTQVTQPAALTTCASSQDPLTRGVATIDGEGDLDVVLVGAGTAQPYTVFFHSIDGNEIQLATITTGPNGNGSKSKYSQFAFGKNGAGYIVLRRMGGSGDQYVTSLFVETSGAMTTRASFHVDLMACKAVNDPDAISDCGSDSFKSGSVNVSSDTGIVIVQVNGAEVGATYDVFLRSPAGGNPLSLGTVGPTDSKGDGQSSSTTVPFATIAAGTVVLTRSGADQAYGGFRVTEKPPKRPATGSGLVRCIDVNFPAALNDSNAVCGTDPLTSGSAILSQSGKLTVNVSGAAPTTTYEVFFRPIDSDGTADMDTKIGLTTDSSGNGKASGTAATSGDIAAGSFVLKNDSNDEFLSGFSIK